MAGKANVVELVLTLLTTESRFRSQSDLIRPGDMLGQANQITGSPQINNVIYLLESIIKNYIAVGGLDISLPHCVTYISTYMYM